MIEPLHFHDWLRPHLAGGVSRPFTERSFVHLLSRYGFALDHNLSSRGNWQTGVFANDYGHGRALQPADPVVFRDAARHFDTTRQIQQRILTKRDCDLAGLTACKIFFAHDAALLARRDVKAKRVFVLNHYPVSPEVDPTFVGLNRDIDRAGADVAAAVQLVPLRRGKLPHVDVFAFEDVLHHGSIFDDFGLDVFDFGNVALDVFDKLEPRVVGVHVQRRGNALHRVQRITKDTITFRVALNLIEQDRFAFFAAMMAQLG